MAKKKKHILTFEEELDFEMIGLCSHHSDYRLAWSINDQVQLHLTKCEEDYIVTNKKGEVVSTHSMYAFEDSVNRLEYYLVKNKHQGQYLIQEKPSVDYFLFLSIAGEPSLDLVNGTCFFFSSQERCLSARTPCSG